MQTTLEQDSRWSVIERIGFRFLFVFILLFIIVENNGAFPFFDLAMTYPTEWLHAFIVWAGEHIFRLPYKITHFTWGSGDTTYDYLLVFCCFVIAVIACIIWSIIDRKNESYPRLYYWLTVIVRFYVGLMLINYGMVKIFKLQFPNPHLYRLLQPYGDSSPMGLAWTFLGFSKGYNLFMGIAEVAGVLLLFRRTTTFGAIITLFTAANVMAINYFYDVPVKILSTALFLLSLFLLSRDLKRLFIFFFTNQTINLPVISDPYAGKRWMKITGVVIKVLLIGYFIGYASYDGYQALKQYGHLAPRPKLWGVYEVERFVKGNETLPPLTTDSVRWKKLAISSFTGSRVYHMTDSVSRCFLTLDTVKQTLLMKWASDTSRKYMFRYTQLDSVHYRLNGVLGSDSLLIDLRRTKSKPEDFLLMGRGFRWINETPFNR